MEKRFRNKIIVIIMIIIIIIIIAVVVVVVVVVAVVAVVAVSGLLIGWFDDFRDLFQVVFCVLFFQL